MKRIIAILTMFMFAGCNSHPKLRCFGASTPSDLNVKNSGTKEMCAIVEVVLFNGKVLQDEVCLDSKEAKNLCYELENIPNKEIRIKIDSEERKVKLKSTGINEFDLFTIKNN
jgi:ribosomal protein L25 (general stress protein Ctc)